MTIYRVITGSFRLPDGRISANQQWERKVPVGKPAGWTPRRWRRLVRRWMFGKASLPRFIDGEVFTVRSGR